MRTTDLSELAAFGAVARHRSFRRASEERGVTASAISHAVSHLEARIGIRLLNRTTRSVSLTDAGSMRLARLSPAFGDIGSALDALNQFRDTPFGKVRINAPNSVAPFVFGPVMGRLIEANPNLELEIVATDRLVDIVDVPNVFISRRIQAPESTMAVVEGDGRLKATASGPCAPEISRIAAATVSSASSHEIRCQPGSGSPFGRVRFMG
jgi:DNA-binding transcriptional LysR family regulator